MTNYFTPWEQVDLELQLSGLNIFGLMNFVSKIKMKQHTEIIQGTDFFWQNTKLVVDYNLTEKMQ